MVTGNESIKYRYWMPSDQIEFVGLRSFIMRMSVGRSIGCGLKISPAVSFDGGRCLGV